MGRSKRTLRQFKKSFGVKEIEENIKNIDEAKLNPEINDFISSFSKFVDNVESTNKQFEDRLDIAQRSLDLSTIDSEKKTNLLLELWIH